MLCEWISPGVSNALGIGFVPVGEVIEVDEDTGKRILAGKLGKVTTKKATWPRDAVEAKPASKPEPVTPARE